MKELNENKIKYGSIYWRILFMVWVKIYGIWQGFRVKFFLSLWVSWEYTLKDWFRVLI